MNPIHRIVVATDFSNPAGRAMRRAAVTAETLGAELHLLHVVHPLALYPGPDIASGDLSRENSIIAVNAHARLGELAASLRHHYGISVHAATRIGRAHEEIADYARVIEAELVVVGARGENTLLDLLLGSTAARVMRVAACPVLIVKLQDDARDYRDAVVALDFSLASIAAPALGRTLAPKARMELLHVYDEDIEARMREAKLDADFIADYRRRALSEAESRLDALLGEQTGAVSRVVITGYPAAAICRHIARLRADLVVLGRHGKGRLEEYLLGSVAKDVANAAHCDVLLLAPFEEGVNP